MDLNQLPIPQKLSHLLHECDGFTPVHSPRKNIERYTGKVHSQLTQKRLPDEIDQFAFGRYVKHAFRDPKVVGPPKGPLAQPLTKTSAGDLSMVLNKLVLRYMNDSNLRGSKLKLTADFIANMMITEPHVIDEVLVQIVSYTWKNTSGEHQSRLWRLLAHFLSVVIPTSHLYFFILKYVSDNAHGDFGAHLQNKLLQTSGGSIHRMYPPSVLEWEANNSCCNMALKLTLPDGNTVYSAVDSWTTAEELARRSLEVVGFRDMNGWSVCMETEDGNTYELSGHDYVLDLFSMMELLPSMETMQHEFNHFEPKDKSRIPEPYDYEDDKSIPPPPNQAVPSYRQDSNDYSSSPPYSTPQSPTAPSIDDYSDFNHQRQESSFSGNFSFGAPNLQTTPPSSGLQRQPSRGSQPTLQNETYQQLKQELSNRIKGGGRMMHNPMMSGQMMQPQNNMQYMPAMQQPMMQQPMMQQPMMQQPMMQQPMMTQPTPMMMSPQAAMTPQQTPMVSQTTAGMDIMSQQQQLMMQQQMQMMMQQQIASQEALQKLIKKSEETQNQQVEQVEKKQSNKKKKGKAKVEEPTESSESEEELPPPVTKPPKAPPVFKEQEVKPKQTVKEKKPSKPSQPKAVQRISPIEHEDNVDYSAIAKEVGMKNDGQGTVKMSFKDKQKFFLLKIKAENAPPKPLEKPVKRSFIRAEDFISPESDLDNENEIEVINETDFKPKPKNSDKHKLALEMLKVKQKEKKEPKPDVKKPPASISPPKPDPHSEALALLQRQRREVASSKSEVIQVVEPPRPAIDVDVIRTEQYSKLPPADEVVVARKIEREPEPRPLPPTPVEPPIVRKPTKKKQQHLPAEIAVPVIPLVSTVKSVLHPINKRAHVTCTNVPWELRIKKEVFTADEGIANSNPKAIHLIEKQIMRDISKGTAKLSSIDKQVLNRVEKNKLIETAMQIWMVYFTRLFSIRVQEVSRALPNDLYKCTAVAIGHTGIHFIRKTEPWQISSFMFRDINELTSPETTFVEMTINNFNIRIFCRRAYQLVQFLHQYTDLPDPPSPLVPQLALSDITSDTTSTTDDQQPVAISNNLQEMEYEVLPPPDDRDAYTLEIFASKYFCKKKDIRKQLRHSKHPLTKSLIGLNNQELNSAAMKCFLLIQRYMNDVSRKKMTEYAIVVELLKTVDAVDKVPLRDEIFIQLIKQCTNNKNSRNLIFGWRLLAIFSSYNACSKVLLPYLLNHLHMINDTDTMGAGPAVVLLNLQSTMLNGGRRRMPSEIEVRALTVGKNSFEQQIMLPGGKKFEFKTTTSSVVREVIRFYCRDLGISDLEQIKEFNLVVFTLDEDAGIEDFYALEAGDYLMDVYNDMIQEKKNFVFYLQRAVWRYPLDYENEKFIEMMFHQVVPDYVSSKYLTHDEIESLSTSDVKELVKLATLIHRGYNNTSLPMNEDLLRLIPGLVVKQRSMSQWRDMTHNQFTSVQNTSTHVAQCEALGMLSHRKMFGASIFVVEVMDRNSAPEYKMVAVNSSGLYIMSHDDHYPIKQYPLNTIKEAKVHEKEQEMYCDIDIEHENYPISLKTKKSMAIRSIIKHHIDINQ